MLPVPAETQGSGPVAAGLVQQRSEAASEFLLSDLGSDRRMKWVPDDGMWLTFLTLDAKAGELGYDLALNVDGGAPSSPDAGLQSVLPAASGNSTALWAVIAGIGLLAGLVLIAARNRRGGTRVAV